jgi:hypothetical protein
MRNTYRSLFGNREGKRGLERSSRRRADDIKIDHKNNMGSSGLISFVAG